MKEVLNESVFKNEFFRKLAESINQHGLNFFLGAGISKNCPSNLPLSTEFRNFFFRELCAQENLNEAYERFNLKLDTIPFERFAASIIKDTDFFAWFIKIFAAGEPNKNHLIVARLLVKGYLSRVLTTNFDTLLERAFLSQNQGAKNITVLYHEKQFDNFSFSSAKTPTICKIHGGVQSPPSIRTTLDLIAKEELLQSRNNVLNYFFKNSGKDLLVLGYSCSDEFDINAFVRRLDSKIKIFVIRHSNSGFRIEKLGPPFDGFLGNQIVCNTDELVDYLWNKFVKTQYITIEEGNQNWKKEVSSWIGGLDSAQRLFLTGKILLQVNEASKSIDLLSLGLDKASNKRLRQQILSYLATAYNLIGNYEEAAKLLKESLSLLEEGNDDLEIAHCNFGLGRIEKLRGNYDEAAALFKQSLVVCKRAGFSLGTGLFLKELGMLSQRKGDLQSAKELYSEALHIQRKDGNLGETAGCLHQLGQVARIEGEFKKAKQFFAESLELNEKLGSKLDIAGSKHELALCETHLGNLDEAQRLFDEVLRLCEELGEKARVAWALNDLGTVSILRREFAKAEALISKSLEINRLSNDQKGICESLGNMGVIQTEQGRYEEAEKSLLEALDISRKLGDKQNMKLVLGALQKLYLKKHDIKKLYHLAELRASYF